MGLIEAGRAPDHSLGFQASQICEQLAQVLEVGTLPLILWPYAGAILRYPSNDFGTKWTDVYLGAFKFRVVDTQLSRQTVQVLCQPWCEVVRFVRPCLPDTRAF